MANLAVSTPNLFATGVYIDYTLVLVEIYGNLPLQAGFHRSQPKRSKIACESNPALSCIVCMCGAENIQT